MQPFSSDVAVRQIEAELGGPLGQFFSEISSEPVAAASLAQVYKAKSISTGEYVAVKVQRSAVLEVVSKDLYVLRRAAEIVQGCACTLRKTMRLHCSEYCRSARTSLAHDQASLT